MDHACTVNRAPISPLDSITTGAHSNSIYQLTARGRGGPGSPPWPGTQKYDEVADAWTTTTAIPTVRSIDRATAAPGGAVATTLGNKIYVVGGESPTSTDVGINATEVRVRVWVRARASAAVVRGVSMPPRVPGVQPCGRHVDDQG